MVVQVEDVAVYLLLPAISGHSNRPYFFQENKHKKTT